MSNPDADSRAGAPPRVLVVGHLTEDRTREGPRLGGAAAFAGLLAHRFGAPTTILTAADAAFPFLDALAGIRILRLPSDGRTRFDNHYRKDGARRQRILGRAAEIPESELRRTVAALPPGSAVLYAPVARELGGSGTLPRPSGEGSFAAAAPQGLLRRWDAEGRVAVSRPDGLADRLAGLDLVSLAEAELPEATPLPVPPAGDHPRAAGERCCAAPDFRTKRYRPRPPRKPTRRGPGMCSRRRSSFRSGADCRSEGPRDSPPRPPPSASSLPEPRACPRWRQAAARVSARAGRWRRG